MNHTVSNSVRQLIVDLEAAFRLLGCNEKEANLKWIGYPESRVQMVRTRIAMQLLSQRIKVIPAFQTSIVQKRTEKPAMCWQKHLLLTSHFANNVKETRSNNTTRALTWNCRVLLQKCVSCGVLAISLAPSFTFGILTGYWHVRIWFHYMIISYLNIICLESLKCRDSFRFMASSYSTSPKVSSNQRMHVSQVSAQFS